MKSEGDDNDASPIEKRLKSVVENNNHKVVEMKDIKLGGLCPSQDQFHTFGKKAPTNLFGGSKLVDPKAISPKAEPIK